MRYNYQQLHQARSPDTSNDMNAAQIQFQENAPFFGGPLTHILQLHTKNLHPQKSSDGGRKKNHVDTSIRVFQSLLPRPC